MMLLIVTQFAQFLIGGVITTGTSNISVPTDLGTGGGFCVVVLLIVTQLAQFLIGAVITTGTGYIGIPADLSTGGRFCIVLLLIVTQLAQFLVSGVITTRASYIGVPTDLSTGGRFRIVMLFVVTQLAQFLIGGVITPGASYIGIPTDLGTGGRFRIVMLLIVTQLTQFLIGAVITTGAGHIGIPADLGTGRCFCAVLLFVVTQLAQFLIGGVITPGAGHIGVPTDLGTGGRFCAVLLFVVTQSICKIAGEGIATTAGGQSISAIFTSGRSDSLAVAVDMGIHGSTQAVSRLMVCTMADHSEQVYSAGFLGSIQSSFGTPVGYCQRVVNRTAAVEDLTVGYTQCGCSITEDHAQTVTADESRNGDGPGGFVDHHGKGSFQGQIAVFGVCGNSDANRVAACVGGKPLYPGCTVGAVSITAAAGAEGEHLEIDIFFNGLAVINDLLAGLDPQGCILQDDAFHGNDGQHLGRVLAIGEDHVNVAMVACKALQIITVDRQHTVLIGVGRGSHSFNSTQGEAVLSDMNDQIAAGSTIVNQIAILGGGGRDRDCTIHLGGAGIRDCADGNQCRVVGNGCIHTVCDELYIDTAGLVIGIEIVGDIQRTGNGLTRDKRRHSLGVKGYFLTIYQFVNIQRAAAVDAAQIAEGILQNIATAQTDITGNDFHIRLPQGQGKDVICQICFGVIVGLHLQEVIDSFVQNRMGDLDDDLTILTGGDGVRNVILPDNRPVFGQQGNADRFGSAPGMVGNHGGDGNIAAVVQGLLVNINLNKSQILGQIYKDAAKIAARSEVLCTEGHGGA